MKKILFCLFVVLSAIGQLQAQKKNVLLIYTDDHRFSGVHILGGQQVRTPNIDRLAEEGVIFTNTYLMGSITGATCVPSRAMLQTGRNMFQLKGEGKHIPAGHTTIGEAFQAAGYRSHIVGKWHQDLGSLSRSFTSGSRIMSLGVYMVDHFRMPLWDWDESGEFSKSDAYLLEYDSQGDVVRRGITKDDVRGQIGTEHTAPHSSEVFADAAVAYILKNVEKEGKGRYTKLQNKREKEKIDEKPFFMYLAFHAPHDPRQAPEKYRKMYPMKEMELLPSYMSEHPFDNGHMYIRDERLAEWPRTEEVAKQQLSEYYAIITHLDEQIGKVIRALKESGQYENTIIVLAGDSGLAVGNHGLMGKQNLYDEDGIHVPFIISGGIPFRNKKVDAFTYIHDIFPTVCELAAVKRPESVKGESLVPVIEGVKDEVRSYSYHAYRQHQRAYRMDDYKLIEFVRAPEYNRKTNEDEWTGSRVTLLFNVKDDPWETQNLAFYPEYRDVLNKMRKGMREKAVELGDNKANLQDQFIPRLSLKYDFWDYYTE